MKSMIIVVLIFTLNSCFAEQLLGGWSVTTDETLKQDCLSQALAQIQGDKVADAENLVSDNVCQTQIVNGLNIKCTFVFNGQPWKCSFYKSFIGTRETKLEGCEEVKQQSSVEI
ncbi:unnamed protein product [Adineta ricciae]|uniref:Uncharacterized protein n=1 Tax=Adineta ricciae TaxID=249248 RepID=A0A815TNG5_ADIRI|nr:unnamed protein product [Adineta ricciae]